MNWYVIFVNEDKINDLIIYFNNQPNIHAFIPKIEKLMKKDGEKVFLQVPMFPNYVFIETQLDEFEFNRYLMEIGNDVVSLINVMQSDSQTVLAISNEEKNLLESLFNHDYTITLSKGVIIEGTLMVQEGPLMGKEEMIKKIDRHKRIALIGNVLGKVMKVPLEVTSKS